MSEAGAIREKLRSLVVSLEQVSGLADGIKSWSQTMQRNEETRRNMHQGASLQTSLRGGVAKFDASMTILVQEVNSVRSLAPTLMAIVRPDGSGREDSSPNQPQDTGGGSTTGQSVTLCSLCGVCTGSRKK